MTDFGDLKVGQTVQLNDDRIGIVRFVGQTEFREGDWVGIKLEEAVGKNDGSVQGQRYFECEKNYGVFARPSGVARILEEPTPKPQAATKKATRSITAPGSKAGAAGSQNLTNGARRQTTIDPTAAKRQSINSASPTPTARRQTTANGIKPQTKPGAKPAASTATSSASSSRVGTPSTARKATTERPSTLRQSVAPSSARTQTQAPKSTPSAAAGAQSRKSLAAPIAGRTKAPAAMSSSNGSSAAPTSRLSHSGRDRPPDGLNGMSRIQRDQGSQSSLPSQPEDDGASSVADSAATELSRPESEPADSKESDVTGEEVQAEAEDQSEEERESDEGPAPTSPTDEEQDQQRFQLQSPRKPPDPRPLPKPGSRITASGRRVEELEAQLRTLERKRGEDSEKLNQLPKLVDEKDKYQAMFQRLEKKFVPQSKELSSIKAALTEAEKRSAEIEELKAEHESQMEIATLDREMAEETAEGLRTELDALRQKLEELELELEVLRDENNEYGKEISPEERTSQGWLQMERSNERMRDALLRLRELTQDKEADLMDRIASLEQELEQLSDLRERHDKASEALRKSEASVTDLKEQLQAAQTAEEMVEELTETNNSLNEQLSSLKTEADELQTINELNDEFELQHQENEKQMQEEIDTRGAALAEQATRAAQQEDKMRDYEYTIVKFRELVTNLQTHLEDMKASQQLTEAEAEELNSRSKAMTDLNMRLQSSAAKTQTNTIDLELKRMETQEATEHLNIVQMFLPDSYKSERKSVLAYLRFKRVAFKSTLLHDVLKDRVASAGSASGSDDVFAFCDILDKLAWISAMCKRFSSDMSRCSMDRFGKYESSLQDLEPLERALNAYVEAWKKGELREKQIIEELQRSTAVLRHLRDIHFRKDDLAAYADELVMRTNLMQSNMENTAAALACARIIIEPTAKDLEYEDEEPSSIKTLLEELESIASQSRSAKVVAGKALNTLSDLQSRSTTLSLDTRGAFSEALDHTSELSRQARSLGSFILAIQDHDDNDQLMETRVRTAVQAFHADQFPDIVNPSQPLIGLAQGTRHIFERLNSLIKTTNVVNQTEAFATGPSPWTIRAEEIKTASATNVATETELSRLKDIMQDRLAQLHSKDQKMEEQNIKIELLESRAQDAGARLDSIDELQKSVQASKTREVNLQRSLEDAKSQVDKLKREREEIARVVDERRGEQDAAVEAATKKKGERATATSSELNALKLEIQSLQGAVRYLHTSKKDGDHAGAMNTTDIAWLEEPLFNLQKSEFKAARERQDKLEREGSAVLDSLMDLVLNTKAVELTRLPENKLSWRPAKEKSSWLVARQQELWEHWTRQKNGFIARAKDVQGLSSQTRHVKFERGMVKTM